MKASVVTWNNTAAGEIDLRDDVFAIKGGTGAIYDVVKMQLAKRRLGTASCKNRALVSGTTAKMYRQKGTGRARHGDYRSNIFVGGGKSFGPRPRNYSYVVPKKVRKRALRAALSAKVRNGSLIVVDAISMDTIKTKEFVARMKGLGVSSGLVVVDTRDENVMKSARNVPHVKVLPCEGLNVYDLLNYEHVVFTKGALDRVQEVLAS